MRHDRWMSEGASAPGPLRRFRQAHERDVLRELRLRGAQTRQQLQDSTGVSRTTLFDIVNTLVSEGAIVESRDDSFTGRGRPRSVVSLNPAAAHVVGVEVGRSHIGVVVLNLAHEVVAGRDRLISPTLSSSELVAETMEAISEVLRETHLSDSRLESIVIGMPLSFASAPDRDASVREQIAEATYRTFGVEPVLDNNSRLVALAETRAVSGAGVGSDDLLYFHLDAGVGGGLVLRGEIVYGPSGRAGEFGHISVDSSGHGCWCGGTGCLERYLALSELLTIAEVSSADELADVLDNPEVARRIELLARVIAGLLSTLDVRIVVLGGSVGLLPGFTEKVAEHVRRIAPDSVQDGLEVRPASLGTLGSAQGGALLGLTSTG